MRVAQKLYEGINLNKETSGLITYMRTDGVQISQEAISNIREFISNEYGKNFIPESPRYYKSKAANAQEAHEAIRPTNFTCLLYTSPSPRDSRVSRMPSSA